VKKPRIPANSAKVFEDDKDGGINQVGRVNNAKVVEDDEWRGTQVQQSHFAI
jgi:hypothetical protein